MSKALIAILALIVGIVVGGYGSMRFAGGAMMGAGAGAGLVTGICMVVQAASQSGLLDESQIDQVMKQAAENISGGQLPEGMDASGTVKDCEAALAKLKAI